MRQGFALSLAVLAAGCTTYDPVTPAPAPVAATQSAPASAALRPGHGRIEAITWLGSSAAAGSSQPTRRFHIRMDDGSVQVIDTAVEGFSTGDWVELTREGYIRRS
jgi:hypothetical protein